MLRSRIWLLLLGDRRRAVMLHWGRRAHVWRLSVGIVLYRHRRIMVLRRHWLLVVVVAVRLHVVVVHLRRVWLLVLLVLRVVWLMLILIMRSPPANIRWHALPCRQMTAVHHAGLGGRCVSEFDRVQVELEMRAGEA